MFKEYGLYGWKRLFWLPLTKTEMKTSKNISGILTTPNNLFQLKRYLSNSFFFFQCKHNDVILTVGREKLGCLIWKIAKNDTFSSSSLTMQCFYSSQYLTPSFTLNKSSWVPVEITHILSSLCTLPHLERKNKSVLQ